MDTARKLIASLVLLACLGCAGKGGIPPPKPPEPPPAPGSWAIDIDNVRQFKVQRHPEIRKGIMEADAVLRDDFRFKANGRRLRGVWVFHGIDPGDKIEMTTSIYADGVPVVLSSPHKPLSQDYEAWKWFRNEMVDSGISDIAIVVSANVTGHNDDDTREYKWRRYGATHRSAEGTDTARPHWGHWFIWEVE